MLRDFSSAFTASRVTASILNFIFHLIGRFVSSYIHTLPTDYLHLMVLIVLSKGLNAQLHDFTVTRRAQTISAGGVRPFDYASTRMLV